MDITDNIEGKNELSELTDVELERVYAGWGTAIDRSFNTGFNTQSSSAYSSIANAYFGSLASVQGNFQVSSYAKTSNYYNYSIWALPE